MENFLSSSFCHTTFRGGVLPGRGAVYFKRTAVKDLFKVDLQKEREREGKALNYSRCPLCSRHDFKPLKESYKTNTYNTPTEWLLLQR